KGVSRDKALPEESELSMLVASVVKVAVFEQPARERIRLYHQQIKEWLEQPHMTLTQVHRLLAENYQLGTSYMSVHRYVRKHLREYTRPVTVRVHSRSGEQAQVDFGSAGRMIDPEAGKLRKAWAFIMILSYSRHRFVRFVFRQDSPTWLDCHIRAFDSFQGIPKLIVYDYVPGNIIVTMCPTSLCGRRSQCAGDEGVGGKELGT
ncbi:DDE-type integrase/transposase/recombinase, partial [Acidobacteria bacterium AH-259-G07]|nr:DDE-type integrase/transposase/recombinase [Acidobacteria bacterium AH-259-G07]